jgi:hypothetical protein
MVISCKKMPQHKEDFSMSELKDALSKHMITWGKWPPRIPDNNPCNYCGANTVHSLSKQPSQEIKDNIKKRLPIFQPKRSIMYQEIFSENAAPVQMPGVGIFEIMP